MAGQESNIPRGLKKRGRTWHISRVFNGRLVRLSTGCADLDGAMRIYRRVESGELAKPTTDWWDSEIEAARTGKKGLFSGILASAKHRAKLKGFDFDLTIPKLLALAAESGGYCAVSSVRFSEKRIGTRRPLLPSLDRIDCTKGYIFTNCRFVCVVVNYAISDFGEGALRIVARAMVRQELDMLARDEHL